MEPIGQRTNNRMQKVCEMYALHCIGKHVIYSAFASSQGECDYAAAMALAKKHSVEHYVCSESDGELLFPESPSWE